MANLAVARSDEKPDSDSFRWRLIQSSEKEFRCLLVTWVSAWPWGAPSGG